MGIAEFAIIAFMIAVLLVVPAVYRRIGGKRGLERRARSRAGRLKKAACDGFSAARESHATPDDSEKGREQNRDQD